jgi:3-deoxy-D-manno-octulosonic-acid transferase
MLVNGRLSSRSFGRYALLKPFMRSVLADVTLCLMQSERDVERIIALGAEPDRVVRTGNIKFDQPLPVQAVGHQPVSRRAIGLGDDEDAIVAGSTHAGEEEELVSCYARLRGEFPSLVLILAPRHLERLSQVEETVRASGLQAVRRTAVDREGACAREGEARVLILDTRGELASVYRHAVLSFVGGTLVPVGGHNLLEPAAWGKPVFFGPHTDHCAEVARLLLHAGGGVSVGDGAQLYDVARSYLRDRQALERAGRMARRVLEENQGATERALAHITKALDALGGKGRATGEG